MDTKYNSTGLVSLKQLDLWVQNAFQTKLLCDTRHKTETVVAEATYRVLKVRLLTKVEMFTNQYS